MRPKQQDLSGWGRYPIQSANCFRPERVQALREICQRSENIIAHGLGRSYGDAALNEQHDALLCRRLKRFLHFDPPTGELECEAGLSLEELIDFALPKGYFIPVTPGTKFVTVGGAIAADVHGKNHHRDGCFSNFVESFELVLASGHIKKCSRQRNTALFWATIGGMGLTGVLLRVTLKLQPVETAYIEVTHKKAQDLEQILQFFEEHSDSHQYSVAWIDCLAKGAKLGRSVLMLGEHAKHEALDSKRQQRPLRPKLKRKKSIPFNFPSFALSPFTVRCFNKLFYWKHSNKTYLIDYDQFFYPLDSINHWNRMYGKRGFVQYQCALPWETGPVAMRKLLEALAESGRASFLAVLKAFGAQGSGLLSFPMPGLTLALDLPAKDGLEDFLHKLDDIVLEAGGRLYLAKDACMRSDDFKQMYPRLDEFLALKKEIDPQNVFQSSQARRLGLVP